MRVMTIRNVPDELYRSLALRAERNRRSLQQEALLLLERAQVLERNDAIAKARAMRQRLSGRQLGDTVRELREERER